MTTSGNSSRRSIQGHLVLCALVALSLVLSIAGWAGTAELNGAVIARGVVIVDSNVKKIQHPTGGVVSKLNVREDQQVKAGDIVVSLDETQSKANLAIYTKGLNEILARQARLEAEKEGTDTIIFPDELLNRARTDPEIARIVLGERKLFSLRLQARTGQKAQLLEQVNQLQEETSGLDEQIAAKTKESDLIKEELKGVLELWRKQLVPMIRVNSLKRDATKLEGERGQLIASKASTAGKISEIKLKIISVDEDARSKVAEELSDVRAKISELSERKIAAEDQLKHVDLRAPQSGRVHQLTVHTVGGVIGAGETILLIVPESDVLSVEAKVSPNDIDELSPDQPTLLRFSAFNMRTTPELNGTVSWIAADQTEDQRTGIPFYTVRIAVSDAEVARLRGLKIMPGMPVELFVQTGSRTMLSYLLKPLMDQITRAFRES